MTEPRATYHLSHELVRLVGGQVGVHACMSGLRMAVPLLALSLGHGAAAVGLLIALFGIGQIAVSIPAGWLADRYGFKRPVYMGMVTAATGALVAAAWPIYPVLCAAAVIEGVAIAVTVISLQRHAGRLARDPGELRKMFAWVSFTPAASNFAGPFIAGLVIDAFGFRAAFLMLGAVSVLSGVFIRRAHELPSVPSTGAAPAGAFDLLRDARVRRVLSMNWFVSSTWDMHGLMVPLLGHARGLQASTIGAILGGFAIAAALVRLMMPWLARRWREWQLLSAAMLVAATLLAVYPLVQSAVAMAICSLLIGCAIGGVQPLVMALLHQITPPHRHGQAVAMRMLMINASSVSMPMLAGTAGGLIGVSGVFWLLGASLLLGSRLAVGLRGMIAPERS